MELRRARALGGDRRSRQGLRHPHGARHPRRAMPAATPMVRRYVRYGASPRGLQAMVLAAKAQALFAGRINVSFDDLAATTPPALRHRVLLNFEGEAEGIDIENLIAEVVRDTPSVPG